MASSASVCAAGSSTRCSGPTRCGARSRQRSKALRARQNAASKEIGKAVARGAAGQDRSRGRCSRRSWPRRRRSCRSSRRALRELALQLPNPADASVPDGGEDDGVVVRVGRRHARGPRARPRRVLGSDGLRRHRPRGRGERLAVRVHHARGGAARARARQLRDDDDRAARLRAGRSRPTLVRERTMEEAGFFPTDRARCTTSTTASCSCSARARSPLSALHRGETLTPEQLPAATPGYSTCFRREAGTYGKDTRGIFRVHQFDKVEMFAFCEPDHSADEHERILAIEEEIVGGSGLPYRVVNIAAGDLGPAAAKKYDIEVVAPVRGPVPRDHVVLELHRLLGAPARHAGEAGERLGARAHAQRHRVARSAAPSCSCSSTTRTTPASTCPSVLQPYTGFASVARP